MKSNAFQTMTIDEARAAGILPPAQLVQRTRAGRPTPLPQMQADASEYDHQSSLFDWAKNEAWRLPELAMLAAVPNGGYKLSKTEAGKLKAAGLKPGYPDCVLNVARWDYHGLFIEHKKPGKLSQTTPDQVKWHAMLRAQGNLVVVSDHVLRSIEVLEFYLNDKGIRS